MVEVVDDVVEVVIEVDDVVKVDDAVEVVVEVVDELLLSINISH